MTIAITNIVALNGGDAAIVLGMIKTLQAKFGNQTKIICFATHPQTCSQLYPDIEWHETLGVSINRTPYNHIRYLGKIIRNLKKLKYFLIAKILSTTKIDLTFLLPKKTAKNIKRYYNSDIIISTGGTYLIESYGMLSQITDYNLSLFLGKKLWFYTQSIGPFNRSWSINKLRNIFSKSQLILCRDQQTKDNIKSLDLNYIPDIRIEPDAAFALCNHNQINLRQNDYFGKFKKMAFSVREWKHINNHEEVIGQYKKAIAKAAIYFISEGYQVYFFSTCQGLKEYTDDSLLAKEICQLIPEHYHNNIRIIDSYLSISNIMNLLSNMDLIIATRLHMCILSLITGTPVFPIAYEFKTIELFHSLSYNHIPYMYEVNSIEICGQIREFIIKYTPSFRRNIINQVKLMSTRALTVLN